MAKTYKGALTLEWYNKQKAIILNDFSGGIKGDRDVLAPRITWVNKDEALFYEINEEEGKGVNPYWVDRNDIRVKEARPLIFQKAFKAKSKNKGGTQPDTAAMFDVQELKQDDPSIENILIRGDNLLALNTLKKMFENKSDEDKAKCIYIDPPYNTEQSFNVYDDNLAISEWLTLIRDRVVLLKELLKEDGVIFISIDDNAFHLKVLLDDIFGPKNFCGYFVWEKKKKPAFLSKMGTLTELILVYAKNKSLCPDFIYGTTTEGKKYPVNNAGNGVKDLTFSPNSVRFKFQDRVINPQNMSEGNIITELLNKVVIKDYYNVNEFTLRGEWRYSQVMLNNIIQEGDEIYISQIPFRPNHIKKGGEPKKMHNLLSIAHYQIDTYEDSSKHSQDLFGKNAFDYPKPEKLIYTLLNSICQEGDMVIDIFGGSGTTFAVAHKMNLKWLGIEIGKQADKNIIPRLLKVLSNNDLGGISSTVNWSGGGSFKYYHLGPSIINWNKGGNSDFNWSLGQKFLEESFLSSYDYSLISDIDFSEGQLFPDKDSHPTIGIQHFGSRSRVAVVSLNPPKSKREMLSYDELMAIYQKVNQKYSPEYVNIFTNRGIELAFDSKPENMEVIKVPHAIFAELEK